VAQVGITDDTVTLVGTANLAMTSVAPDSVIVWDGLTAALRPSASTRGAAMTTGAAIQRFFTRYMMCAKRYVRRVVNRKFC
jgi:urease accessory protein UreF